MGEHHLLFGDLGDTLLDGRARHEPIDHHLVLLADTMCARERLDVVVRVPVRVVDDDRVGRGQVYAKTAGARRQQETELLGTRCVKPIDGILPLRACYCAVDSFVFISVTS